MSRPKHHTDGDGRMVEHFRQERLEHLRKSIDEGTYHVNDRNVAAAIETMQIFLSIFFS